MRSSGIIQVGPKSNDKGPCKMGDTDTQEKAVGRQKQTMESCSHKSMGEYLWPSKDRGARMDSLLVPPKEVCPCKHLDFGSVIYFRFLPSSMEDKYVSVV